jgi:hypothetical protein
MRFKKILHSPTSTNHRLNARSPLGNVLKRLVPVNYDHYPDFDRIPNSAMYPTPTATLKL